MTQVNKYGSANNSTTVLHTVTASTVLHLDAITLAGVNLSGGGAYCSLYVTDDSDVLQYNIYVLYLFDNDKDHTELSFPYPVRISAGYKVKINSTANGLTIYGYLHGIEQV